MEPLDLLVIGGGITGLGVARLAARNGLSIAVLERADLASGASSASSHMLHGGLRYLEHGRIGLVHEALRERAAVSRMAPGLAKPTRFLVPLYRGGRVPPWKLRLGLWLYDALATGSGFERHGWLGARAARALEPALEPRGLRGAGLYADAVMDDARLAVAVARDAARHGAQVHTWTEVTGARPATGGAVVLTARDRVEGGERSFVARAVVIAAGPWTDQVRALLARGLSPGRPEPAPLLRPSRGTHLVYPRLTEENGLLLIAGSDGRAFFVVPFAGRSLVGTTEVEVPSPPPPEAFRPTLEEVRYLSSELARALPAAAGQRPLAACAGVRPLLRGAQAVGRAPREHRVLADGPLVTVAGGKYTTFRVMARDALALAARRLGRGRWEPDDDDAPLPEPFETRVGATALAAHAAREEFARRLEDVMRRRTALWLEEDRGRAAAPAAAEAMARTLGWDESRTQDEIRSYDEALREEESLLHRALEAR
ncbi:MAG: FAD-dependent oxidoreductase [Candidatus Eisenbacteria bacterium]|nr:FAD-dependent oxidoreductase [Candidatus Eisenbacteria bacterium]